MSLPERADRAFTTHDAFRRVDAAFELTTTAFEVRVTAAETDGRALRYAVTVRAPMLSTAVETGEEVGSAVEDGWFETYGLRLEDAPGAVRAPIDLDGFDLVEEGGQAAATFEFEWEHADRAPAIAKALAEFAEGTYVEGIVPGYSYADPVASLLSQASQGEGGGGTPL